MTKILIVDDAKFIRVSLKMLLEKNEFEVVGEAEDATTALKMYKELKPDIVTMDITMPGIDGIETLKMIKDIDKKAKVVMLSAMGQREKIIQSIKAGALTFIVKPFHDEVVISALKKIAVGQ